MKSGALLILIHRQSGRDGSVVDVHSDLMEAIAPLTLLLTAPSRSTMWPKKPPSGGDGCAFRDDPDMAGGCGEVGRRGAGCNADVVMMTCSACCGGARARAKDLAHAAR